VIIVVLAGEDEAETAIVRGDTESTIFTERQTFSASVSASDSWRHTSLSEFNGESKRVVILSFVLEEVEEVEEVIGNCGDGGAELPSRLSNSSSSIGVVLNESRTSPTCIGKDCLHDIDILLFLELSLSVTSVSVESEDNLSIDESEVNEVRSTVSILVLISVADDNFIVLEDR
jgi:hypothetical protein